MAAPVTMMPKSEKAEPEKISMTAPVIMQQSAGQWSMYFVMPSPYTLSTLPTPNNATVTLRELSANCMGGAVFFWFGWGR